MKPFHQKVYTANGQQATIIGSKSCKTKLNGWTGIFNVLITNETIRQCILGLDVLSACPITKPIIQTLRGSLRFCTKFLQAEQNANQIDSTTDNSSTTEQTSASEKQQITTQDYMQVNQFKFSKEYND